MGDFFLRQMEDFFTEGLCFDNRQEGEGERQPHAPPFFSANKGKLEVPPNALLP